MEEKFKVEIITPEQVIFSDDTNMVTLPSYEGDMSILKNHISIITFLRPGILKIQKSSDINENFFVEDGIIEFYKDNLSVLSTSAINIKNLKNDYLENLTNNTLKKLKLNNLTDSERYILNHKVDVIENIKL
tara:strand:- start:26 stop:421 length:396 start_codon:yes stop_codon:yes gene_type:complete